MKKTLSILLLLSLLLSLAACGGAAAPEKAQLSAPQGGKTDAPTPTPTSLPAEAPTRLPGLRAAADYDELFKLLSTPPTTGGWYGGWRAGGMAIPEAVNTDEATAAAEPAAAPAPEHSDTNVQVQGVDEGDIVKTDGKYIYVLSGDTLRILAADGADTRVLFSKRLGEDYYRDLLDENEGYKGSESRGRAPQELYIRGDRLAVVYSVWAWGETYNTDGGWTYTDSSRTEAELYDVGDPASPKLLTTAGQDGGFVSSRMTEGTLYLVSRHYVRDPQAEDPGTFVPCLYRNGVAEAMDCRCIWYPETRQRDGYAVVSAVSLEDGSIGASVSLLGGADTVYMSAEDLYLARSAYVDEESAPRTEAVYTVTDHSWRMQTDITRVSLAGGGLTVLANGSVDGSLLNQFSMDAWNGNLRLVTTLDGYRYTTWEDKERGFVNTVWPEENERGSNALYVLDGELNTVGSLTGLAEDERVYSVRFDGDTGYFVTFRQVDPLFAVDLSDPASPKLLSALKIPGFSEYLHVWGEGRLLGLGRDADPETGRAGGLKLSMFDTSDKTNVTEKHKLLLPGSWSEALYNHKAILVSPEKNVFAFPTESGYAVYGYDDAAGFTQRAELQRTEGEWWYGSARGLYAGDFAYVVFETGVWVLDLDTLAPVTTVSW